MSKIFVALLVVSLVAFVAAFDDDDDSSDFLGSDDGDMFGSMLKPLSSMGEDFIKNLKPTKGGHVTGHATSFSHEVKTVNGKKVEDETKQDKVDNVDGNVNEEHSSS